MLLIRFRESDLMRFTTINRAKRQNVIIEKMKYVILIIEMIRDKPSRYYLFGWKLMLCSKYSTRPSSVKLLKLCILEIQN